MIAAAHLLPRSRARVQFVQISEPARRLRAASKHIQVVLYTRRCMIAASRRCPPAFVHRLPLVLIIAGGIRSSTRRSQLNDHQTLCARQTHTWIRRWLWLCAQHGQLEACQSLRAVSTACASDCKCRGEVRRACHFEALHQKGAGCRRVRTKYDPYEQQASLWHIQLSTTSCKLLCCCRQSFGAFISPANSDREEGRTALGPLS